MAIEFDCENCGKHFTVKDGMAGRTGKCTACGTQMKIPYPVEVVAAPVPSPMAARPVFPPPQPAYPQPYPQPPANVQVVINQPQQGKSANGLGVAAVILGILALLVCWLPLVSVLAVPLILLGGLFGIIGLIVALGNGRSGSSWPLVGIGLNALAMVVLIVANVLFFGAAAASVAEVRKAAIEAKRKADLQADKAKVPPGGEAPAVDLNPDGEVPKAAVGPDGRPFRDVP